ncbi:hypothetical protein [Flavobacterium sp. TAB 87]|uniref:hypothetical protein n=1 Tax=Flavobacterium sp. TAB 87 TaxID=1729581 RepID=UPI00076BDD6A|nr:hypothetical protein [Flavobacterium sp. TAB 87]KVV15024.1 hypothetical protein AP058_01582 [Flavobacterium sp. TAB 87]
MKIFTLFLIYFLFIKYLDVHSQSTQKGLHLEIGSLYNSSSLNWSIAGNAQGKSPNILSELKFNNIKSLGAYIKGEYKLTNSILISALLNKNEVINGEGTDTDYKADNRNNPFFEKKFISNKGYFTALKTGFSFPIRFSSKSILTPSILYYLTKQKFYILNNEMQDLQSTYQTDMSGIEISIKTNISLNKFIHTSLTLSYHKVNYNAEADWNLIEVFKHPVSFSQTSKGSGYNIDIVFGYKLNKTFSVTTTGSFDLTNISEGIDTSYLITGKDISTQFNGAKNTIYSFKLGIITSL